LGSSLWGWVGPGWFGLKPGTLFYLEANLTNVAMKHSGYSVFAGVGERTREGNDLYNEMKESNVLDKVALCMVR